MARPCSYGRFGPEDADIEREFVASLSPEARYMRFMTTIKELSPEMLARFTQIVYDSEMALIALVTQGEREIQIAVARYVVQPNGESREFAIVVGAARAAASVSTSWFY